MYYLGQHPDIQQRAREEINTVLKGKKIASSDLRSVCTAFDCLSNPICCLLTVALQLPYLTAVIKEGMRIQPPVGLIPTRAAETDVEYGGITFTKGVSDNMLSHWDRVLTPCSDTGLAKYLWPPSQSRVVA